MGYQNDDFPLGCILGEHTHYHISRFMVQGTCGFIKNQYRSVQSERTNQGQTLLLSPLKLLAPSFNSKSKSASPKTELNQAPLSIRPIHAYRTSLTVKSKFSLTEPPKKYGCWGR